MGIVGWTVQKQLAKVYQMFQSVHIVSVAV